MLFKCRTVWINWPLALQVFIEPKGRSPKGLIQRRTLSESNSCQSIIQGKKLGHICFKFLFSSPNLHATRLLKIDDTIIEEVKDSRSYGNRSSTDLQKKTGSSNLLFSLQQN